MGRFGTSTSRSTPDTYTGISGVAALILLLGCLWLIFHNMEYSSTSDSRQNGGMFKILD